MKTILYATDYSENSVAALKYAYGISLKLKVKLWVIHVFDYPTLSRTKAAGLILDLKKGALKDNTCRLEEFCKQHLGRNLNKMQIEVEAIHNKSSVGGIISKAEQIQSLLIITGMKGESELRRLIMGSTARDLIDQAPYPVLTIPEDTSYNEIKTIVYATDFQEEDLDVIGNLSEIARLFNAKIIVTHISPQDKTLSKIEKELIVKKIHKHVKYDKLELDFLYSDDIFDKLKIYYGKINADIIAMLERKNTSLTEELFYKSLLKKMKSYGRIPLMSFNAKNYRMFIFKNQKD